MVSYYKASGWSCCSNWKSSRHPSHPLLVLVPARHREFCSHSRHHRVSLAVCPPLPSCAAKKALCADFIECELNTFNNTQEYNIFNFNRHSHLLIELQPDSTFNCRWKLWDYRKFCFLNVVNQRHCNTATPVWKAVIRCELTSRQQTGMRQVICSTSSWPVSLVICWWVLMTSHESGPKIGEFIQAGDCFDLHHTKTWSALLRAYQSLQDYSQTIAMEARRSFDYRK